MRAWLHTFLACQGCGGELSTGESLESDEGELITGSLSCPACELSWPVLGGVPILLADPGAYLSSYRESLLTSLLEFDHATPAALGMVDSFCLGYQSEAMRYGDDWTAEEAGEASPELVTGSVAQQSYRALIAASEDAGLHPTVLKFLGEERRTSIVEVGPGAGGLSALLAARCERLVLIDLSLRSALCSQRAAKSEGADVAAIVGDAAALELASECAHAVVAANLVDLLDGAQPFLASVSRWLEGEGSLVLTTPDPSLGGDSDECLRDLLEALEYKIDDLEEGIPWIRQHSGRYSQLYWLQALRASILS